MTRDDDSSPEPTRRRVLAAGAALAATGALGRTDAMSGGDGAAAAKPRTVDDDRDTRVNGPAGTPE